MHLSIGFMVRNPQMTVEEFRRYWDEVHAPLILKLLTPHGIRRYRAKFPVPSAARYASQTHYDAIVEMGFDSEEALDRALASADFQCDERRESSARCFDHARGTDMVAMESDAMAAEQDVATIRL